MLRKISISINDKHRKVEQSYSHTMILLCTSFPRIIIWCLYAFCLSAVVYWDDVLIFQSFAISGLVPVFFSGVLSSLYFHRLIYHHNHKHTPTGSHYNRTVIINGFSRYLCQRYWSRLYGIFFSRPGIGAKNEENVERKGK